MKQERLSPLVFFVGIFALWEVVVRVFNVPHYLLPPPLEIAATIIKNHLLLLRHFQKTLLEVCLGMSLGLLVGVILAILIARFRTWEMVLQPLLVVLQTMPKIAIAPLLLIWLGYGILPKIVISALVCFFPVVINFSKGLKSLDPDLADLLVVYQANRRETLFKVRIPNALPDFFAGLKIAIPLSVIGVLVGEFIGAQEGLGHLIMVAEGRLDIALMFASTVFLSGIGTIFFGIIRMIEKRVIFWHLSEKSEAKLMW